MIDDKPEDPAAPRADTLLDYMTGRGPRPGEQEAAAARGASDDVDDERLTTALGQLRRVLLCGPEADVWKEYARAYLAMARAGHRPLSWDTRGHPELLDDPRYLYRDAVSYAQAFLQSRECGSFWFDQSGRAGPAVVWAVAVGGEGDGRAVALMRMAIERIEEAKKAE